jgi:hypothetical protein
VAQAGLAGRIAAFGDGAGLGGRDVPDPSYGTAADFAAVGRQCLRATTA